MLAPARSCWQAKGEACGCVVSGVAVAWIPAVSTPLVPSRIREAAGGVASAVPDHRRWRCDLCGSTRLQVTAMHHPGQEFAGGAGLVVEGVVKALGLGRRSSVFGDRGWSIAR